MSKREVQCGTHHVHGARGFGDVKEEEMIVFALGLSEIFS